MASFEMEEAIERASAVAREVVAPLAERTDREARWPEEGLRALLDAGLGGLVAPVDCGGLGLGVPAVVRVGEILGRECGSTSLCFGMHQVATAVIAAKASGYQRRQYLEPICAGAHLTTLALSEPGTGAHFWLPETRLSRPADGRIAVTGTKSFVTNGNRADSYVVSASAGEDAPGRFSCVVVPASAGGLTWSEGWNGIGMRGNSSIAATLDDVVLDARNLLGEEGDQIWYVFEVVAPYFLAAMAGTYLGIADAALEAARAHLSRRRHSHTGSPLGKSQVLQHRLGELWAVVERTRQLTRHAADLVAAGRVDALATICACKAEASDCAVRVVNDAMTLVGGIGYRAGGQMDRWLRDARAAHVMSPTTDLLRTWTGRAMLGEPLLGD